MLSSCPKRCSLTLSLCLLAATAAAQEEPRTARGDGSEPVTLTQTVKPAFRIEPVVHRFTGRRGEVIPFEFVIGSLGSEMVVSVTPVNLRQEESGVILHDDKGEPARALKLHTPRKFLIGPGREASIRGQVTVPLARTNYLSYGLLVRESGTDPDFEAAGDTSVRAGIRFVTQYVLRIDIETGVADIGSLGELRLERGGLVADRGLPRIRTYLTNPTDYAFECHVNAVLPSTATGSKKPRPIHLGMPSRSSLTGPERHLVRVMPRSTLRLEAPVDAILPPGEQTLRVALSSGRRNVTSADFALDVRDSDFPALAQQRAIIAGGVSMAPAQIEIGTIGSARRSLGLRLENTTDKPVEVSLAPATLDGEPLSHVRFSPSEFTLKPGRTKGVRATLRRTKNTTTEAAVAVVTCKSESGEHRQRLPLAILHAEPQPTSLRLAGFGWRGESDAFAVEVTNPSSAYTPIDARLAVGGRAGVKFQMQDGYGRWLEPGETRLLTFTPGQPLPAGDYKLKLELRTREGFPPITRELNVTLSGPETTASAGGDRSGQLGRG